MPVDDLKITRHTPQADLPEHLSVQEMAAHTGLAPWTIYQLVHQGKIPHRRLGKTILIPKSFFAEDNAKQQVTA